jgi:hypothetical protein
MRLFHMTSFTNRLRRGATAAGLLLAGMILLTIPCSVHAQSASGNTCRAYVAVGWYLLVNENIDSDSDGVVDNVVSFRHPAYGTLDGTLDSTRSSYNPNNESAEFWGVGTFRGESVVINVKVSARGGYYGRGRTWIKAYVDRNGNGVADPGEREIFPSNNAMSNQMTLLEFASSPYDLNGDGRVDFDDLFIFIAAFDTTPEDRAWNADADFNGDDRVDCLDLALLIENWG